MKTLEAPKDGDTQELIKEMMKREEDELVCRGHIFNALSDRLYYLYTNNTLTKEIWEALEKKYKIEEERTKKFITTQYMEFKFFDGKPLLPQVHEL